MRFRRIFKERPRLFELYDVPETTQDSYGQPSLTGTLICSFEGTSRTLRGNEMLNVRQIWPTATHLVRCRWFGSAIPAGSNNPLGLVMERMYLVDAVDSTRFNILNANNVEKRNQEWELTCEEKAIN